jgi:hypothetical protein
MNKYGPKAQEEIHKAMDEFKGGKLKSGSSDCNWYFSGSQKTLQDSTATVRLMLCI